MGQIKLRISDEELVNAASTNAQSFIDIDVAALRRAIEAAGVEAPELEQLRADMAQFSEEMGLPPGIRPAPGELRRLFAELAKLTELRSLLSSGQCVDLAQVSSYELGIRCNSTQGYACTLGLDGDNIKAWLIEKGGVKL